MFRSDAMIVTSRERPRRRLGDARLLHESVAHEIFPLLAIDTVGTMTRHLRRWVSSVVFSVLVLALSASSVAAPPEAGGKGPLRVGFSDWPGWTAVEIGIQKGWFKE